MLEIADLFCSGKTSTRQIIRSETFFHLNTGLTTAGLKLKTGC